MSGDNGLRKSKFQNKNNVKILKNWEKLNGRYK